LYNEYSSFIGFFKGTAYGKILKNFQQEFGRASGIASCIQPNVEWLLPAGNHSEQGGRAGRFPLSCHEQGI